MELGALQGLRRWEDETSLEDTPELEAARERMDGQAFSEASSKAAAPSLTPEALPAVTVPFLNSGLRDASVSRVVSGRGCSSVSTMTVPLRVAISTATISRASRSAARAVFCCER